MADMEYFIEVEHHQIYKKNEKIGGDVFLSSKSENRERIVCALSDGLGSGVKANVLATLTAKMATKFMSANIDVKKSADIIMRTLPVCKERKISYSTFTILDIMKDGFVKIVEYDNPEFILIQNGKFIDVNKKKINLKRNKYKDDYLLFSEIKMNVGDRIIFFSDGVSQSGIGSKQLSLGWKSEDIKKYIFSIINQTPDISARDIAHLIVSKAYSNDMNSACDDITCGSIYFRKPRKLLIATGPPVMKDKDSELARLIKDFDGKKIISGGTTANIVARELNKKIKVNIDNLSSEIPPYSDMEDIDLVTEGMITLSKVIELINNKDKYLRSSNNAAKMIVDLLINSDYIFFLIGTKINEAHQDPNMPVEMDIRRTIINRIINALEKNYLKTIKKEYI